MLSPPPESLSCNRSHKAIRCSCTFAWHHFVKRGIRISLKDLIYQLTAIAVWIVGLLIAVVVAFPGMTPSKAVTVLGLGSVAIGFAFKDIFENSFPIPYAHLQRRETR